MAVVRLILTAAFMVLGLFVCCVGVYGVFKLKYAANRMHAAALNDTMGISLCLVGLAISAPDVFTALKILLVVVFLWLASPVASHLLCRLEVETNEQRGEYMNVHEQTLAQERIQAAQTEESEAVRGKEEEQA
jgi:putative Na+/H+ antiporter, mnhG component